MHPFEGSVLSTLRDVTDGTRHVLLTLDARAVMTEMTTVMIGAVRRGADGGRNPGRDLDARVHDLRRVRCPRLLKREFFVDNLLVRIHYIIVMVKWAGLAPWEFESPFPVC